MKVSVAVISLLLLLLITIVPGAKTKLTPPSLGACPGMAWVTDTTDRGFALSNPELTVAAGLSRRVKTRKQGGPYHPTECCFVYTTHTIRRQRIADYYETSSQCSKPGVVFITQKGYRICADPSEDWVQDYIKDLE